MWWLARPNAAVPYYRGRSTRPILCTEERHVPLAPLIPWPHFRRIIPLWNSALPRAVVMGWQHPQVRNVVPLRPWALAPPRPVGPNPAA